MHGSLADNPRWAGRWVQAREQFSAIYVASRDETRDVFAGFRSGRTAFLGTVMGTLHVLFLEVSGLIFICFSVTVVSAFFREYRKYALHQVGLERVVLAGAIGSMFLYFGLNSFWRARRKRPESKPGKGRPMSEKVSADKSAILRQDKLNIVIGRKLRRDKGLVLSGVWTT